MAVIDQKITEDYAIYNGDCCEVLPTIPDESIHLSVYSPPFATEDGGALYNYSSSDRDFSNSKTYDNFFKQYEFLVKEIHRVTLPGRFTAVHCMDVPRRGERGLIDFPGDIIRLHERLGFWYWAKHDVWKEPLAVRNRTMARGLAHRQVVEDSSLCDVAAADNLILFRKKGDNPIPIEHPVGLVEYAGSRKVPNELLSYKKHPGKQRENKYSHWIWRQYASAFWDDIRIDRTLPYKESKEEDDERHMHPLQLDVIDRVVILRSNPKENVLTPFMGVGSEVFGAVRLGRRAVGIELKASYYKQSLRNIKRAKKQHVKDGLVF